MGNLCGKPPKHERANENTSINKNKIKSRVSIGGQFIINHLQDENVPKSTMEIDTKHEKESKERLRVE